MVAVVWDEGKHVGHGEADLRHGVAEPSVYGV